MLIVESNRGRFDLARSWRYPGEILTGLSRYGSIASRVSSKDLWLVSPGYDLVFIIFWSALLVVSHLFAQVGGLSNVVDLAVTAFIGRPHLFATYTMSLWSRVSGSATGATRGGRFS